MHEEYRLECFKFLRDVRVHGFLVEICSRHISVFFEVNLLILGGIIV